MNILGLELRECINQASKKCPWHNNMIKKLHVCPLVICHLKNAAHTISSNTSCYTQEFMESIFKMYHNTLQLSAYSTQKVLPTFLCP